MTTTDANPLRLALGGLALAAALVPMLASETGGGDVGHLLAVAALVAGGALSGLLAGLLGIGGALVSVPVFYLALPRLGVAAEAIGHVVVSSSLVAMVPTILVAAWSHRRRGTLDLAWLTRLAPAMAIGAVAGALLAAHLQGAVLAFAFAAQAMFFGCRLILRNAAQAERRAPDRLSMAVALIPTWLAGPAMAGFCACVGMGGGSMVTPYLQARGLGLRSAVATACTLNLCIAVGGGLAFCVSSSPSGLDTRPAWGAALLLGCAAALLVPYGVTVAARLRTARLAVAVGLVNIVGALALLAQVL